MADNRNWMQRLPPHLRRRPLVQLCIPGSHESATSFLNVKMPIACDLSRVIRLLNIPTMRKLIYRWSRCQSLSVMEQLCKGVRYLDIRVACSRRSRYAFTVHGLYGHSVEDVVDDVLQFLHNNPDEVVILDFNHFYNFSRLDHTALVEMLIEKFSYKLVPSPPVVSINELSLDYCKAMAYQLVIFVQAEAYDVSHPLIWDRKHISSPWADTSSLRLLMGHLDRSVRDKHCHLPEEGGFFVSQGVLTPSCWDVVKNCGGTLRDRMSLRATSATVDWLLSSEPGLIQLLNVVIVDFVEFAQFCDRVIQLNFAKP